MPDQTDRPRYFLGINLHRDPACALVAGGRVLAYSEEERHLRVKHAIGHYPTQALRSCLRIADIKLADVEALAINWDLPGYAPDGAVARHYQALRQEFPVDPATVAWQEANLRENHPERVRTYHEGVWRRTFGVPLPELVPLPHHWVHAFHALCQSPYDEALVLTVDGSGDQWCSVLWAGRGTTLTPIKQIPIPHSLGWFYAAFTEYLGFHAYDGEYKVMGLAAYGKPDPQLERRVAQVLTVDPEAGEYRLDPTMIHYGDHSWSGRFTDALPALLGRPPRLPHQPLDGWHQDLAFAVQARLEEAMEAMVRWGVRTTALDRVCIGGGVGLNVKANSRLLQLPEVADLFPHPLCGDAGAACGAALALDHLRTGSIPERVRSLAVGHVEEEGEIRHFLEMAHLAFERPDDLCATVAEALAQGRIVGWCQGAMEAGPRALGQRSILADPREVGNRDKVNAIVKHRELWRPFCPSMTEESAPRYLLHHTFAPFMSMAFTATEALQQEAPAVVHIDGTCRVQLVNKADAPLFHRLLEAFAARTGVPVLLNTSFNVKGEPMICTTRDALRTFFSTGLDLLAIGPFVLRKPVAS